MGNFVHRNKILNYTVKVKTNTTTFFSSGFIGQMLIVEALAMAFSFISDFLQPLAPVTGYLFFASAVITAILLFLYITKVSLRTKILNKFLISSSVMVLTGLFYFLQDETNNQSGVLASKFPSVGNWQSNLGLIQEELSEIKESTIRTEKLVETIVDNTGENIKQTKQLNETIKESSEAIVNKLEDINDSFNLLTKSGGLILNAERPEEFYHNSRTYEERGDYINARRSYNQYFSFKLDFIDPHLRFQTFLKIQEGKAGAREVYSSIYENDQRTVIEFLKILLFDAPFRTEKLKDFISRNPDFAPAYYELSRDYSPERTGVENLRNRKLELQVLEKFIQLNNEGKFVRYFIDKGYASNWIEKANARLHILNSGLNEIKETYYDDGTVHKETTYKDGIREGEERVFLNKESSIIVFDGSIVDHTSRGHSKNLLVKNLSWYKSKNVLIEKNIYKEGSLISKIKINYYKTGEILERQTLQPADQESMKPLLDKLSLRKIMNRMDDEDYLDKKIRCPEGRSLDRDNFGTDIHCMGGGPDPFFHSNEEKRLDEIKRIQEEIDAGLVIQGPYEFYYKNGQIEEKGLYENNYKQQYSFFSKDGKLEEKGSRKRVIWPNTSVDLFSHGNYERYYKNGQLVTKGEFRDGELLAPYKIYYENGTVFLEKNASGEYKKFNEVGLLIQEIKPIDCENPRFLTGINFNIKSERRSYNCFKSRSLDEEGNLSEWNSGMYSPFPQATSWANCLSPKHLCTNPFPTITHKRIL